MVCSDSSVYTPLLRRRNHSQIDLGIILGLGSILYLEGKRTVWHYSLFYRMGIPGPFPYPIVGTFVYMMRQGFRDFQISNYKRYEGHKVYGIFDGAQPMLVLRDPDMIKDVCIKHFSSFVNRRSFALQPPADHMMTMLKDDHWKNVRSIVSPAFSSGKVRRMYPCVARSVTNLVRRLKESSESGELVELKDALSRYSMDVITGAGFGVETNSHEDSTVTVADALKEMMNMSSLVAFISFLCPWLVNVFNFLGLNMYPGKAKDIFVSFVDAAFESRKQEVAGTSPKRNDFLQMMMEAQEDEGDAFNDNLSSEEAKALKMSTPRKPLTRLDYQGQALVFYLGSYDTVANVTSFTLFLLALHPECLKRVQEEIDEKMDGKTLPSIEMIAELPYLDMCVNEGLRMFPPGVLLDRICNKECTIQGVKIPEGVGISFHVYALHHDPELWPDPESFDPERFTPENKANRHPIAHMSFGHGPRNCVGMRLAQLEVKMALAGVLYHMTPVPCEKTVYPVHLETLQLKAVDGLWFLFLCNCKRDSGKMAPPRHRRDKKTAVTNEVITKECTIHMHKRIHGIGFKDRAPRAIKEIRKFAAKMMGTPDVRIDIRLNKFIWSQGIRHVPYRLRVRLARKRNEDEDSTNRLYTLVTHVPCADFKGKQTLNVDNE
ncbi:hypothetical protein RRG08_008674 [Elysia crispata]|nr:hypothetical protein RRG08_008674 [Elysia crispata]